MDQENRVVVLVDMDCFYCQVEEKLNPELAGKPIAVVQYNPWKGGGIIAVNYVARARGVTRHMRGDEAKAKCPEIQLPSVPCLRGKADITKYRDAGKEVVKVLQKYTPLLERASIDEAYLDITAAVQERLNTLNVNAITKTMLPNCFSLGYDSLEEFIADVHTCGSDSIDFDYEHAKKLLVGALIVSEMRAAVYAETGYRCSAGIAHNKILAKLVCGMNKPNKQTVLPKHAVNILYKTLPLKKVKHLGGKFGDSVKEILGINTMGELQQFSERELQMKIDEKNGTWLYNMARGINLEPVQARFNPKSIGCCKQLRGKSALTDLDSLRKWLRDLGDEIEDRLEKDALETNRTPKQMVVSFSTQLPNGQDASSSRSYNFMPDDDLCGELFFKKSLDLLMESAEGVKVKDGEENRKLKAPIKFLGISVGKFEDNSDSKKVKKIKDYFNAGATKPVLTNETKENIKESKKESKGKKGDGKEYVLRKFFQTSNVLQEDKIISKECNSTLELNKQKQIESTLDKQDSINFELNKQKPIESTLDKQESFFAKFLTAASTNKDKPNNNVNVIKNNTVNRCTTPVCSIVQCGDDSNDTDYSGSTINMEINKSIALFEDDAEEVARVSGMRYLLDSSKLIESDNTDTISDSANEHEEIQVHAERKESPTEIMDKAQGAETIECPECKKTISLDMVDVHADYHVALNLRNEERQLVRQEREKAKEKKDKEQTNPNEVSVVKETSKKIISEELSDEKVNSIANFFIKLDNTLPTEICSECGKKVPVEKFTEHLDFHEAQKLSRILNNKSNPVLIGSSTKRKRRSTSPLKKPKIPCKSIDLFFR